MSIYRTRDGSRYYTANDGSRRRVDDPDRHRLSRREKKAQRRARTAARLAEARR